MGKNYDDNNRRGYYDEEYEEKPRQRKKVKQPKKKKRKFKILNLLLTIIITVILLGGAACAGLIMYVVSTSEDIDFTRIQDQLDQSSFILDEQGNVVETISSGEYQVIVPMEEISDWMKMAVVAIEDERFYKHNGVDVRRVFGAALANVKSGSFSQGASTITMQVAKNLYTSSEKSIIRKVRDAYYAIEMEKVLSKEQILNAYLNTMALSRGTVGVEAAANTFFNKSAKELDLAESALLAGVTKSPTRLSPYTTQPIDPAKDLSTMQIAVLVSTEETPMPTAEDLAIYQRLYELGKVSSADYAQLKNGTKYAREAVLNPESKERQELVLKQMYKNEMIDQATYEAAVAQPVELELRVKPTNATSSYFVDCVMDQVKTQLASDGYAEEDINALIYNGGIKIYSTMDQSIQKKVEQETEDPANFPGAFVDENGVVQPQTSAVVIDQYTGHVKVLVGGRNLVGSKLYNRATNPRQPGSSIKPLVVYMPALESGMTAATVIDDSPRPDGKGGYWPKNSTGYLGYSTLSPLVWNSSNVAAVEVLNQIGINTGIESLKKQGFTTVVTREDNASVNDENLSLALGGMSKGMTNLEITSAYSTIANGGVRTEPIFFTKIETSTGRVIYENQPKTSQVFKAENCFIMTKMLENAATSGTGKYAKIANMTTAGKTGTTSDKKDAWFVGYTPYYTCGVWIGADMPVELSDHSRMAARLWNKIMTDVHQGLENKDFEQPENIVAVRINKRTGGLDPNGIWEFFIKGTEPTSSSSSNSDIIKSEFDDLYSEDIKDSTIDNGNNDVENSYPGSNEITDDLIPGGNETETPTDPNAGNGNQGGTNTGDGGNTSGGTNTGGNTQGGGETSSGGDSAMDDLFG